MRRVPGVGLKLSQTAVELCNYWTLRGVTAVKNLKLVKCSAKSDCNHSLHPTPLPFPRYQTAVPWRAVVKVPCQARVGH